MLDNWGVFDGACTGQPYKLSAGDKGQGRGSVRDSSHVEVGGGVRTRSMIF